MHDTFLRIGEELGDLRRRITDLETSLGEIIYWARRLGILVSLWAIGIVSNYSTERAAELAASILRLLTER